jgi:hypothetical protein
MTTIEKWSDFLFESCTDDGKATLDADIKIIKHDFYVDEPYIVVHLREGVPRPKLSEYRVYYAREPGDRRGRVVMVWQTEAVEGAKT